MASQGSVLKAPGSPDGLNGSTAGKTGASSATRPASPARRRKCDPWMCCNAILSLRSSPKELWLVLVLKCLESYAYFAISLSMTVYLTESHGFSDTASGVLYGTFGLLASVYGLLSGWLIDYLGVKYSLAVGAVLGTIGRFMFAVGSARWVIYTSMFGFMPLSLAFGIPVLTIAIRRYTNNETRTVGFAVFYSVMNISALLAGPATDLCRLLVGSEGIVVFGARLTELRVLFLTSTLASFIMIFVALCGMREVNVDARGEVQEFKPQKSNIRTFLASTCHDKRFWRLMLFTLLIVFVRLIFRHLDATWPKYFLREVGPDAAYGSVYAINPGMVIILVPIVGAMTRDVHPFSMILYGSFVSAGSVFFLCLGASYLTSILFVVTLSLGEAVYSPRVYEYTMLLSPKGREGLYTSLASAPMFVAKLFAGSMSGALLANFCAKDPPRNCQTMWAIIGGVSIISPVLMLLLRKVIQPEGTSTPMEDAGEANDAERSFELTVTHETAGLMATDEARERDAGGQLQEDMRATAAAAAAES